MVRCSFALCFCDGLEPCREAIDFFQESTLGLRVFFVLKALQHDVDEVSEYAVTSEWVQLSVR